MENLFQTTWWEDLLIILFLIAFCWSVGLFMFSLIATVLGLIGQYALRAVALYWGFFLISFLLVVVPEGLIGLPFFILGSPIITFGMRMYERDRIRKHNTLDNSVENGRL